jgi:hypothetical protein
VYLLPPRKLMSIVLSMDIALLLAALLEFVE